MKTLSRAWFACSKSPTPRRRSISYALVKTTTLGNLIAFMHVYNLRFGAATNPHQKFIYDQLYPLLDDVRDRITKESKRRRPPRLNPEHVSDFFNKLEVDQAAKKQEGHPQPPNPQQ